MSKLDTFIEKEKSFMRENLLGIVEHYKVWMRKDPKLFIDEISGQDEASIDIRLCIDLDESGHGSWIFRTGDSSYDQRHSQYCAADCIGLETNVDNLLNDLINQIDEV